MTLNSSIRAYDDCRSALDRAIQKSGVVVEFKTEKAAKRFAFRANYFRKLAREENKKLYDETHSMWGCSVYDNLIFQVRENRVIITILANDAVLIDIETNEQFVYDPALGKFISRTN